MCLSVVAVSFALTGATVLIWIAVKSWNVPSFALTTVRSLNQSSTWYVCQKENLRDTSCISSYSANEAHVLDNSNHIWKLCGDFYCFCCFEYEKVCANSLNVKYSLLDCPPSSELPQEFSQVWCQASTNRCFVELPYSDAPATHIIVLYSIIGFSTWFCMIILVVWKIIRCVKARNGSCLKRKRFSRDYNLLPNEFIEGEVEMARVKKDIALEVPLDYDHTWRGMSAI
jgi:hypothetical protein